MIIISSWFSLCSSVANAQSAVAVDKYNAGDYEAAIEAFDSVASKDGVSSELLYDLGNAYYKKGDLGHAQWCYMRALKWNPANSKARNNMEFLKNRVADNIKAELKKSKFSADPDSPSFFRTLHSFISARVSSDIWAWGAAIAFVISILCVAAYLFVSNLVVRKIGFFASFISIGIAALLLIFSFMAAAEMKRADQCVLTAHKIVLKSEPSPDAKDLSAPLTRGAVMEILQEEEVKGKPSSENEVNKWYKVRYNSDFVGWLPSSEVLVVAL